MKIVNTSETKRTPYGNLQFATEVAFDALVNRAIKDGLLPEGSVNPHLMYLPTENVTQQFKDACRAVIADLGVTVENG